MTDLDPASASSASSASRDDAPARFTEEAWHETARVRAAIHALPFNRELAAGTLSRDRFRFYITQDALYLKRYGRALATLAGKAHTEDGVRILAHSAHVAIEVEQSMHGDFLRRLEVPEDAVASATMAPTCQAYTDFLVAAAFETSYPVGLAAILPCFWIYWDVGCAIAEGAAEENFYRPWIDTYADPGFGEAVEQVRRLTDEAAVTVGPEDRARMLAAFVRSTEYELLFWDAAYRRETWPTA